jgi:hypothetical protein
MVKQNSDEINQGTQYHVYCRKIDGFIAHYTTAKIYYEADHILFDDRYGKRVMFRKELVLSIS